ncbi:hypothetical protein ACEQ6C_40415, partial [Rhizobium ruizarguesonis]
RHTGCGLCPHPFRFPVSGGDDMAVNPTTTAAVRASGAVPNAESLLSAEGVRKEFPGVVALADVQFRLKRA